MSAEAFTLNGSIIYWDSIIVALGILVWFVMTSALYTGNGGKHGVMWLMLPFAVVLSVVCSRTLYWYCHVESYASLKAALTEFTLGGHSIAGIIAGPGIAALLMKIFGVERKMLKLTDCMAPGAMLALGIFRLSELFNSVCRSKIMVENPDLQHLPLASGILNSAGGVEYRFATFFAEAALFFLFFFILLIFFSFRSKRVMGDGRGEAGCTTGLFLLLVSAAEMVLDSTRYDASFFSFNAFIGVAQMLSAITVLVVMICFSVRSIRYRGIKVWHFLIWIVYLGTVGGVGYLEYLVQRHGNWYLKCYSGMGACSLLMILMVFVVYCTAKGRKVKEEY